MDEISVEVAADMAKFIDINNGAAPIAMLALLVVKGDKGEMALFPTTGGTVFFVSSRHLRTCICLPLFCDSDIEFFAANIAFRTDKTGACKRSYAAFLNLLLATAFFLPILVIL